MWFEYNLQINFCYFSQHFELSNFSGLNTIKVYVCINNRHLWCSSPLIVGIWRGHPCPMGTFYAPPPESGGVLCYTLRNFECPSVCLSVRPSVSAHHHSCIGNSSYSFRPILLKLYRCFKDGLKICILFFQNPEIIFYHFFPIFNLDIFRALILQICIWSMYLVSATPPTVFGESFWNFTGVLRMVWRYAYCFFRILKLFFITFFAFLT